MDGSAGRELKQAMANEKVPQSNRKRWAAWIPWVVALAALGYLAGLTLWLAFRGLVFPYQLDYGEGLLLHFVNEWAHGRPIYGPIGQYPFVTANYPPLSMALALALTLVLGAALPTPPNLDPLSLAGMLAAIEQIAMGLLLGLELLLVSTEFFLFRDVVSTQLGLSMAVFNDPMNGVSSASIIYQLYFILLALLFFAVDGHLVTVSIIYQSFVYWPIGSGLFYDGLQTIAWSMAWVISAALLIALPIVFCMTLVQFCFGLLNRISPAMNLFSLGFPMAILAGLSLIYLTLPNLAEAYLHLTRDLLDKIGVLLRSSGHV
jgi:flagellar biosynthetic protein FliR